MRVYCTYFDRNYLPQGLALHRSLRCTEPRAELWTLCLDEESRAVAAALDLPGLRLVSIDDLLRSDPRLRAAQHDRAPLEFYYACTPQLIRYVRAVTAESDGVAYVDADMWLFQSPRTFLEEQPDAEILLVEHGSGDAEAEAQRGRFNVSFVHFAASPEAGRALDWWCEQTLASTATNDETWGDQKYLDRFPDLFAGVGALRSPRTTLAPWNVWHHEVRVRGGVTTVDGVPLAAFHYARLLVMGRRLFSPARREWLPRTVLEAVYRPYFDEIRVSIDEIRRVAPGYVVGHTKENRRRLLLGVAAGRVFYNGRRRVRRLGFYVPSTRRELSASRCAARGFARAVEEQHG